MEGVGGGHNHRRIREAPRRVAAHAQIIAWKNGLGRVRIMTIRAPHPSVMHPTTQEGAELIVLIANLTIRIKDITVIRHRQEVMIKEVVTWFEVPG